MFQKRLTLVLIILVALQSVAACADAHHFYQTGTDQHESDNENNSQSTDKNLTGEKESNDLPALDQYYCDNCCNCHGITYYATNKIGVIQFRQKTPKYHFIYFLYLMPPDTRPPIV